MDYIFTYTCADMDRALYRPCDKHTPLSDKCFDCIGMNTRFTKYFEDNRHCSCGSKVDFGYFLLIFHFDKAGILPDDFKIMCCACYDTYRKKVEVI